MWPKDLLLSLTAILSFLQLGLIVDYYLIQKRALHFNPAIFFGLGAICVLQMAFALFSLPVTDSFVRALSSILFLPLILDRSFRKQLLKSVSLVLKSSSAATLFQLILLLIFAMIVVMITFSHPVWGYDAIQRWLAKTHNFWIDNGVFKYNVTNFQPADDPNLWPLSATWLFHILGKSSDFWVQVIPASTLVLLVLEFRRRIPSKNAFLFLASLVFAPYVWQTLAWQGYSGNADLLVSFYFLLAFGALLYKEMVYAAVFLGLAALTKNDALPALLVFIFLAPFFKLNGGKRTVTPALIASALFLFNIGWKYYFGLSSRYLESDLGTTLAKRPIFEYTKYSLQAFREEFRFTTRWGLGFWIIGFLIVTRFKKIFKSKEIFFAAILFSAQFVSYIWIFYITREDQATQVATSIYRLVLQFYPGLLLLAIRTRFQK